MHFLLSTNPELVKNYRIRSVGYEDYIYKVIFVIEDGTYYSEI